MQVAQTILQQLGGNRFTAMTGAKNFVAGESLLQFSLPSNFAQNKANRVVVKLEATDTYAVEFYFSRGVNSRKISEHSMIYADMLRKLFVEETGLQVSL